MYFYMTNKLKITLASISFGLLGLMTPTVLAQSVQQINTITKPTDILNLLTGWLDLAFTFFFIVAIFFILWAAFVYLTSAGDEEKVKTAKNRLMYAVVAIIVALVSKSLPLLIRGFFPS